MFTKFVWDNKKPLMSWEKIIAPIQEGELNMPDIKSRYEAIEIMWVKKWLTPNEKKPKWITIVNEIIHNNVQKAPMVQKNNRLSWIFQSWHGSEAEDSQISSGIRYMIKIARKYNINAI